MIKNILIISVFLCALAGCNPAFENITGTLCDSLHPQKPLLSDKCHGEDYRFPSERCTDVRCHNSDLKGGNSGSPSCYKCHDDLWTIFSTTHKTKFGGYYHDSHVNDAPADTNDSANWYPTCRSANCHGSDLTGVRKKGYSCMVCHGAIPAPLHTKKYDGHRHHRDANNGPSSCTGNACHGSDPWTTGGGAGRGPACKSCHSAYPGHSLNLGGHRHDPRVDTDYLQNDSNSFFKASCKTALCHGLTGNGGTIATSKCTTCHSPTPPPGHRVNYEGHKHHYKAHTAIDSSANANNLCGNTACHGSNVKSSFCNPCHD